MEATGFIIIELFPIPKICPDLLHHGHAVSEVLELELESHPCVCVLSDCFSVLRVFSAPCIVFRVLVPSFKRTISLHVCMFSAHGCCEFVLHNIMLDRPSIILSLLVLSIVLCVFQRGPHCVVC